LYRSETATIAEFRFADPRTTQFIIGDDAIPTPRLPVNRCWMEKLDKAIAVLRELSGTNSTPSPNGKRRTLTTAARKKIAKAQKARWAKFRKERAIKA
jgi:hypothetical protein